MYIFYGNGHISAVWHVIHEIIISHLLTEFCQDVSDTQMPQVAPVILPQLLKVIVQPEVYSVRTRSRAVHIFNTISNFIYSMSYTFPVSACGHVIG